MRLQAVSALALVVVLCSGCKNKEAAVPGNWKDDKGNTVSLKEDKTFTAKASVLSVAGTWKMDGDDVVMTLQTLNGQTVDKMKPLLESMAASNPGVKKFADNLDKPSFFKLADDGKSMTTDTAKDTNGQPSQTLTKQDGPAS
jgi:hypothetical protein